jgi:hypothetical protein
MQNKIKLEDIISNWDEYKVDLLQKGIIPGKDNRALIPETKKVIGKFCGRELNLDAFLNKINQIKTDDKSEPKTALAVWGARSVDGIRFIYLVKKYSDDKELDHLEKCLRDCMAWPEDSTEAKYKINKLDIFVSSIKSSITENKVKGKDPSKNWKGVKNNIHPEYSIFLLSLFWDMQDYGKYPVYYISSKKIFKMAFSNSGAYYKDGKSSGEEYLDFCNFIDDLKKSIEATKKEKVDYTIISVLFLNYVYQKYKILNIL